MGVNTPLPPPLDVYANPYPFFNDVGMFIEWFGVDKRDIAYYACPI